jgi:cysteinyl-tRNA synthetase
MSKSLGNIKLVNDILKKYSGNVIRLSLLSSHYRQPMDWSEKILEQSKKTLMRFRKVTSKYQVRKNGKNIIKDKNMEEFLDALYDDLNTPKALAIINGWFDKLKKKQLPNELLVQLINKSFDILGINLLDENSSNNFIDEDKKNNIERMIEERKIARQNKDFNKADQIREKLKKMNVLIDDTSDGTKWTVNDK